MTRRRLLVWCDVPPLYGAGRQAAMVADGLARRGHHVVVAQRKLSADSSASADELISLTADDLWAGQRRGLFDRAEAAGVLDAAQPEIVVVNDSCPVANQALKQELVAHGIPWIAVEHGTTNPPALDTPEWRREAAERLAEAAEVVAVSHAVLTELRHDFGLPAWLGCVVANARPDEFFSPVTDEDRLRSREELGLRAEDFVVLVMARVEEDKGTSVVLRAIEELEGSEMWDELRLLWAGDGTQRRRVVGLTRIRGWCPQVAMLGFRDDARRLLTSADVLLHISSREGMPLAVLEAMATGVLVIGSAIPAIVEATAGTTLLVPDPGGDRGAAVAGLVAALSRAHGSPALRKRLALAGRGHAEDHQRHDRAVDGYEAVLNRVA